MYNVNNQTLSPHI